MYIDSEMHQVKACACECPLCFSGGFNTNSDRHVLSKKVDILAEKHSRQVFIYLLLSKLFSLKIVKG